MILNHKIPKSPHFNGIYTLLCNFCAKMANIKFNYRFGIDYAPVTLRFSHKQNDTTIDVFINTKYNTKKSYWFNSKNEQHK